MYVERRYVGVCSKCGRDAFVEIYTQKLDMIQSCECINNQIVRCEWWETYVFYPITWKVISLPVLLMLFSTKFITVLTILGIALFARWACNRQFCTQNKVATKWLEQPTYNNW